MSRKPEYFFISAGEHSGDLLGADLTLALKEKFPRSKAVGIAGSAMIEAGVQPLASTDVFSVIGVVEVMKKVADYRMLASGLLQKIEQLNPKFAVLIDNPGFHLYLAEQMRLRGIRVFQYVAPKVWAWGHGRVAKLKRDFERVLGILPFEEQWFHDHEVPYTYVGTPQKDRTSKVMVERGNLGVQADRPIFAFLPGSRLNELKMMLPMMIGVKEIIQRHIPDAVFLVPAARNLGVDKVAEIISDNIPQDSVNRPLDEAAASGCMFSQGRSVHGFHIFPGMSLEVMAVADVALVTSGTATLECALLETPMVVAYSMNELTYQIAKAKIKLPYVSLANLIAEKKIVNEYIQDFSIGEVAGELVSLYTDKNVRNSMLADLHQLQDKLQGGAAKAAADEIHRCVENPVRSRYLI